MGKGIWGGGSGSSPLAAEKVLPEIGGPFQAVMHGIINTTDYGDYTGLYTGPTLIESLEASVLSSPFEDAVAPDPTDHLADMKTVLDRFIAEVEGLDATADLDAAVAAAATAYDTEVSPSAHVTAVVTAHTNRKAPALLRSIARANASAFNLRAVMTTQHDLTIAALVAEDAYETDDFAGRLDLLHEEKRSDAILRMTDAYLGWQTRNLEAARAAAAVQMDYGKLAHTMVTDWYESNLEYETLDATWELDRGQQFMNLFSPINGAAVVPRSQTPRERLVAAVMSSASIGLQAGASMGPAAGIGLGAANLAAQLYAMRG